MRGKMLFSSFLVALVASRCASGFALPSRLPGRSEHHEDGPVPVILPHERFLAAHSRVRRQATCGNGICEFGETFATCGTDCRLPSCGNNVCEAVQGETATSCPTDCLNGGGGGTTCNFNLICEPTLGETAVTCPNDCGPRCGDGICQSNENFAFCPQDCTCGNGQCQAPNENFQNCPSDCKCGDGFCDPTLGESAATCFTDCPCGNGICDTNKGEVFATCPQDCPAPTPTTTATSFFPAPTSTFDPFAPTTTNPFFTQPTFNPTPTFGSPSQAVVPGLQCNNNGICEAANGETAANCGDCNAPATGGGTTPLPGGDGSTGGTSPGSSSTTTTCNQNGACDAGESWQNCPSDCSAQVAEGNKINDLDQYIQSNSAAVLKQGERLKAGGRLNATCDVYLQLKMDGNIVIQSESQGEIWESGSSGQCTKKCVLMLDSDGILKLMLKIAPGQYEQQWSLSDKPAVAAVLLNTGNFVTVDQDDVIAYQTGTSAPAGANACANGTGPSNNATNQIVSVPVPSSSVATESLTDSGVPTTTDPFASAVTTTDPFATPATSTDPFATTPVFTDSSVPTDSGFSDPAAMVGSPTDMGAVPTFDPNAAAPPTFSDPGTQAFPTTTQDPFTQFTTPTPTPSDTQGYCGDSVCVPPEEFANCPQDCPNTGSTTGDVCGDGFCGPTENAGTCANDCQNACGDGFCGATENSTSCPVDCYCGNGVCEPDEVGGVCPADCPQ